MGIGDGREIKALKQCGINIKENVEGSDGGGS